MRNAEGEKVGPPVEEDGNYQVSGDEESASEPDIELAGIDLKPDSEGWNDVEDDTEDVSIKCLFCEEVFGGAKAMNEHCGKTHEFDLAKVQVQHGVCLPFETGEAAANICHRSGLLLLHEAG